MPLGDERPAALRARVETLEIRRRQLRWRRAEDALGPQAGRVTPGWPERR